MVYNYVHGLHSEQVKTWYLMHHQKPMLHFPVNGFIVPNIMACWLILTDWNFVILDPLISNPLMPKITRQKAFKEVYKKLELFCIENGYSSIHAFSNVKAVLELASDFNFKDNGEYNYLVKRI